MKQIPTVGELMKTTDFLLHTQDSLQTSLGRMRKRHIQNLPVVKDGRVVGVLSDSHLSLLMVFSDEFGMTVEDAMTIEPLIVTLENPVDDVVERMATSHKDVVVVQDTDGVVRGTFSTAEALRVLVSVLRSVYEEPWDGEITRAKVTENRLMM